MGDFKGVRANWMEQGKIPYATSHDHAHSGYFHILATSGLLGIAVFSIAIFLIPGRIFYRKWYSAKSTEHKVYSLLGITLVISYAVFGLTEAWQKINPMINQYIIYFAIFYSSITRTDREKN